MEWKNQLSMGYTPYCTAPNAYVHMPYKKGEQERRATQPNVQVGRRVGCRLEIWPLNRVIMLATAKEREALNRARA